MGDVGVCVFGIICVVVGCGVVVYGESMVWCVVMYEMRVV